MTSKMTIHAALAELKILDSRIQNAYNGVTFAVANKASNAKIKGKTIETVKADAESAFQSAMALIRRRKAIRNALSRSNAVTTVVIGDQSYTVAEALEMRKEGLFVLKSLVATLEQQKAQAIREIERKNNDLDASADSYVIGLIGSKEKAQSSEANTLREAYIKANSYEIVEMRGIDEKVRELKDEILRFEAEVDSAISVSNAMTFIEI